MMRYLLDTQVLLCWLTTPEVICLQTRRIIEDKATPIFVSSVSFWEIAIKNGLGRLILPSNLLEVVVAEGFQLLNLTPAEALGVADLPYLHVDPFDRLLVVQAKHHDLVLITPEECLRKYPVVTIPA